MYGEARFNKGAGTGLRWYGNEDGKDHARPGEKGGRYIPRYN